MSNTRLENFALSTQNKSYQKKISSEMDDFWDDCIDLNKLNEPQSKKINNPEELPEDYITCKFF